MKNNEDEEYKQDTNTTVGIDTTIVARTKNLINKDNLKFPEDLYISLINAYYTSEDISTFTDHLHSLNGPQRTLLVDEACKNYPELGIKILEIINSPSKIELDLYDNILATYMADNNINVFKNDLKNLNYFQKAELFDKLFTQAPELAGELTLIFF